MATEDVAYVLDQVTLSDDEDDEFEYHEEPELDDEEGIEEEDDDDLEALMNFRDKLAVVDDTMAMARPEETAVAKAEATVHRRPEVVDDFIRNFFVKMGMKRSLESFETEWYEMAHNGTLKQEDIGIVPDIYLRNQDMSALVKEMREQLTKAEDLQMKAKNQYEKLRKERDFHRMHHKRVVQEKNKLIGDLKRVRTHCANYEPTLNELQHKYEAAMKEKMLVRLEKDKQKERARHLEASVANMEVHLAAIQSGGDSKAHTERGQSGVKVKVETQLPSEERVNPHLSTAYDSAQVAKWSLNKTFKGHQMAISNMALHPKKSILATVSDDRTWRIWSLPAGELVMSAEGHQSWLAGVDFHPHGTQLATSAGDGTIKIWDFASGGCVATFADHTQACWAVSYHDQGDFLVSASMDQTARLWDINAGKCRQTFRGHMDSINAVQFQPYSNNIATGSGDKTVSVWDARSGLCIQTFYGHQNAVNHVGFSLQGDTIVSADADGVVKLWDVRMVAERCTIDAGPHPANYVSIDGSGEVVAVASDDGTIKSYKVNGDRSQLQGELRGHEDAVQCVLFDRKGESLISAGTDATWRVWK